MKVRFTVNGNVADVVDHTPRGSHEATLAQVEAWQEAGVPLELIDEAQPVSDEQPTGRKPRR